MNNNFTKMPGTETSGDCQYSLLKTIKQDVSGIETSKYATDKVPQMSFADVQNLYKQDQMSANLQDANHHLQPKHDTGLGECSQQIEIEKSMLPQMNMGSNEFCHGDDGLKMNQLPSDDEKPYPCPECIKRFSRSDGLRKHMLTHTGEKPYSCSQCCKRFTRTDHLKKHMMIHTGEKPHSCPQCFKRFARADHMKKHLMTHSSTKPYPCAQRTVQVGHEKKDLLTQNSSMPPSHS
ncbi:hypothetical protein LSH36_777g02115 [Paralvinella palmiformis]|uniref:C2H2-type domain-containing protein n=1 Tax=Paralvinella palmiformis TaxID=53620 RepID=A0AAD9J097_9ANNE|nr:hypothetical protein LSH36_777g02115 [Paralvinella palmiformis]